MLMDHSIQALYCSIYTVEFISNFIVFKLHARFYYTNGCKNSNENASLKESDLILREEN